MQDIIKGETDQRNQLLEQGDTLNQQSYHEQKGKSVDLFIQAADARKKAADLTVKLDQDNLTLSRAQADLSVRQGQHESLTTAVKSFDNRSTLIGQDWTGVQAKIAEYNADSKKIMGDDPVNPPVRSSKTRDLNTELTIGSKAAAIKALAEKNHELRGLAETHFNSASGFYKDAEELAQSLQAALSEKLNKQSDPSQSPDGQAFNDEKTSLELANYRYFHAVAALQKAEFYARGAAESKSRLDLIDRLKPIVAAAGLNMPPTLDDSDSAIASQLKTTQSSARCVLERV